MATGNEGATPGDTEVAGQSPADDEQQNPEAAIGQEPDSQAAASAPGADGAEPVADSPVSKPDEKAQG